MDELTVLERELGPGLRRTLAAVLDDVDDVETTEHIAAGRRWWSARRLIGVAAAVTVLAAGLAAVARRDGANDHGSPVVPAASGTASTPAMAPTTASALDAGYEVPAAPATPAGDTAAADGPVGIFLPATPIEGFTLTEFEVGTPSPLRPVRHSVTYLRPSSEGTADLLAVRTRTAAPEELADDSGSVTVHGVPAHIFDSGAGVVVMWSEGDLTFQVTGIGVGWDELAGYADASVIAPDGTVSIPGVEDDGFAPSESDTPPPAGAVETVLDYTPDDDTPGLFVSISVRPNDELTTIDVLEVYAGSAPAMSVERGDVGGRPAVVQTSPENEFGTMTIVQWFRDGLLLSVTSRLPRDDVLAIAESLQPATAAEARALDDQVQAFLAALPELDRAALPNGFDVSIHASEAGGGGDVALCLHAPIERCQLVVSESSIAGEAQPAVIAPFVVGATEWQIAWAEGVHQPVLLESMQEVGLAPDVVQGAVGTFVAFVRTDAGGMQFDSGANPVY